MQLLLSIAFTSVKVVGFLGVALLVAGACASAVLDHDHDRPVAQ